MLLYFNSSSIKHFTDSPHTQCTLLHCLLQHTIHHNCTSNQLSKTSTRIGNPNKLTTSTTLRQNCTVLTTLRLLHQLTPINLLLKLCSRHPYGCEKATRPCKLERRGRPRVCRQYFIYNLNLWGGRCEYALVTSVIIWGRVELFIVAGGGDRKSSSYFPFFLILVSYK